MEWSKYSETIFDTWASSDSNIVVQACPGAGKTTNIAHLWSLDDKSTVYVVFNKAIQLEAESKLKPKANSAVLTTHSLGLRAISATYGRPEINDKKVMQLIRRFMNQRLQEFVTEDTRLTDLQWMLKKAVDVAKFSCDDVFCTDTAYRHIMNTFDLDEYPGMQEDIGTVLEKSDWQMDTVDFADMIRIPALYRCNMPQFDHVLCDEVQDFNGMQAMLISKLQGKKYCLVGDRHQSIYAFRGAMQDSMDYLARMFCCVELPLSISYRCPVSVVQEARKIWPGIEAWEHAWYGQVRRYGPEDERVMAELGDTSHGKEVLILCRNNAPLIGYAYQLLRQKIPCHVRGRNIGEGLVRLVKQFPVKTVGELIQAVHEWGDREIQLAQLVEDTARIEHVNDKVASLVVLSGHVGLEKSPDVLIHALNELFAQGNGIALSTVHKAKGLEAKQCYLLRSDLFKSARTRAGSTWQMDQEKNVEYVAVTRAQEVLTYC